MLSKPVSNQVIPFDGNIFKLKVPIALQLLELVPQEGTYHPLESEIDHPTYQEIPHYYLPKSVSYAHHI